MRSSTPTPRSSSGSGLISNASISYTSTASSCASPPCRLNYKEELIFFRITVGQMHQTATVKASGRVKVGVRCRPAFKDEIGIPISFVDSNS